MAKQRKKRRKRLSNKGKITLQQRMRIVEKNDATRVQKTDTTKYKRITGRPPADIAPTFRIKIKRK